ncbi:substrate-binding domain-containing protein [Ornithinimicrobium faecis]|uniref:Substrate-binding domain-containing protein n=1 Tax=Ornithinimicrobium faecis TaxID=2934158 RepID=A0ABY4YSF6_9MICO|nr:substrate-binding domain-containing protein [Ornithinimicrobium sp. HY1793]USQ79107.1 substrate-binding domain-containing protein [Ornithinimicrobium sp. HY1793]
MTTTVRRRSAVGITALLAFTLSACGANDPAPEDTDDTGADAAVDDADAGEDVGEASDETGDDTGGAPGGESISIALLLPETQTTRYEAFDKPLFEAKVAELCEECEVLYYNADQDETAQSQQVDTAISEGASVIVLDPVNGAGAGGMVTAAQAEDIPVIAYDRFIAEADYYMSFDNETVGKMQGEALVEAMGDTGNILMLNGAPSDPNAAQFKAGAHSVIDASGLTILEEYDNPDWSPENAQQFVTDQLSAYDPSEINGVYAANDGQAGGVVAALTGGGIAVDDLPPITGQDAELAAVQRIVAGQQAVTVYKPIPIEAETAAELAVTLARGEEPAATSDTGVELSDFEGVPSYIFDPIAVTQDNVNDTIVADGFYSADEICTGDYAAACESLGLGG